MGTLFEIGRMAIESIEVIFAVATAAVLAAAALRHDGDESPDEAGAPNRS